MSQAERKPLFDPYASYGVQEFMDNFTAACYAKGVRVFDMNDQRTKDGLNAVVDNLAVEADAEEAKQPNVRGPRLRAIAHLAMCLYTGSLRQCQQHEKHFYRMANEGTLDQPAPRIFTIARQVISNSHARLEERRTIAEAAADVYIDAFNGRPTPQRQPATAAPTVA